MPDALADLLEQWKGEGILLATPLPRDETQRFFENLLVPCGLDVVDLYTRCAGFEDQHLDENYFTLWPLPRIQRESPKGMPPFLQFGNLLIDSHRYAFTKESEDVSSVWLYCHDAPKQSYMIAHSVTIFLNTYALSGNPFAVLHKAC